MLFEAFREMRRSRPQAAAFYVAAGDRALPISWKRFTDDIEAIAYLIETRTPGATIALLGENSYEWITAHVAIMFSGAKVVPLDVNLSAGEIAEMTAFVGAEVLVHSSLYVDKAKSVSKLRPGMAVHAFGSRQTDLVIEDVKRRLGEGVPGIFSKPPPDTDSVSMLVFTSGTTLRPRAVRQTLKAVETCCEVWASRLDMKAGDHSLMVLPLHHIFGMCAAYLMLSQGVAIGVCPDFRRLYDAVERFRADFLFLVPALADILAGKIELRARTAAEAFGAPIRWILTGGAPLQRRTYDRLRALGVKSVCAYGLTETASLYSVSPVSDTQHPCCAGKVPVGSGVETRVAGSGELLIRGPNVFKGYYGEKKRTEEVLDKDGWFHTGDVGEIDGEGFVTVKGRISRTIVLSSGKKIAPEELEERLQSLPGVLESMVCGTGDVREIRAEIYASLPDDEVRRAVHKLNLQLPTYKRIRDVSFRKKPFPRTASGKIKIADPGKVKRPSSVRSFRVGRWRLPIGLSLTLGLASMAVALLTLVPNLLMSNGVVMPKALTRFFGMLDFAGEVLLVIFAVVYIFKVKSSSEK